MSTRSLLVIAPNWLGDAIMALPLIADVRRAWPDTAITVAARKSVAPLFAMVPAVDDIVALGERDDLQRITRGRFDAALLLPNSFSSAWLVARARVPERWGFARDLRRPLLTRPIRRPRRYGHQVDYYQALGTALGVEAGPRFAAIVVPADARDSASTLLGDTGIAAGEPFVVLAPGAAYGRAKQWLPERFAELARRLADDGIKAVLVGTNADRGACDDVARQAAATNVAGKTDLRTLAGVLTLSRAAVANDSGAMHLAAAAGVPVTAIFGPTDDHKTAPLRARAEAPAPTIVATSVWCRPCMLRECPIDHRCMTQISAARVYESLRVALS
jgi:heptosyltransferase-2